MHTYMIDLAFKCHVPDDWTKGDTVVREYAETNKWVPDSAGTLMGKVMIRDMQFGTDIEPDEKRIKYDLEQLGLDIDYVSCDIDRHVKPYIEDLDPKLVQEYLVGVLDGQLEGWEKPEQIILVKFLRDLAKYVQLAQTIPE